MSSRKHKGSHHQPQSAAANQPSRRAVLAALGALGAGAAATLAFRTPASLQTAVSVLEELPTTDPLPVVFVGHGTPFSAIDPNVWTAQWDRVGRTLPRPAAILMISAHWLTRGASLVTASAAPQMNYDISGFPREIYEFTYPAPGHPAAAREVERALQGHTPVQGDSSWGLDHGTWLPLKYMFPSADIPVLQLSIDYSRPPAFHYELAKRLRTLRSKGVLIIGSGNVVHNLGERGGTGITETPRDWAVEFDKRMASAVASGRHSDAIDFLSLGALATQAHPTYDHFLPFLYSLGLVEPGGPVQTFCEGFQWPGISMRSFVLA
jgi:4,5-DOPA dioxygenase extradiol